MVVEYPYDVNVGYLSVPIGTKTGPRTSIEVPSAGMDLMGGSNVMFASHIALLAKLVSIWCHLVAIEQYDYAGETVTNGLA